MDFDKLTPADLIGSTFISDGKKEESGEARMNAAALNKLKKSKPLSTKKTAMDAIKKAIAEEQNCDEENISIQQLDPSHIDSPEKALIMVPIGMGMAAKALEFLHNDDFFTHEEVEELSEGNKMIHGAMHRAFKRFKKKHHEENPDCSCSDDATDEDEE